MPRLNEAEAREFELRERVRSSQRVVEEDVTLIWNELQDILVRLEYLDAYVKSTEEVLSVYIEQLTLGKRTLLDLLDVQKRNCSERRFQKCQGIISLCWLATEFWQALVDCLKRWKLTQRPSNTIFCLQPRQGECQRLPVASRKRPQNVP